MPGRRLCPVCYRPVEPTMTGRNIQGHYDQARNLCPASYEPFGIAIDDWLDEEEEERWA